MTDRDPLTALDDDWPEPPPGTVAHHHWQERQARRDQAARAALDACRARINQTRTTKETAN